MDVPSLPNPFDLLGGEEKVRRLGAAFYEHMAQREPELARIHELDAQGRISASTQERFTRFLMEWLGGPKTFSSEFGHPRLRMRHAHVRVTTDMRDAWLRSMQAALDEVGVQGDMRGFLNQRFADLADFLRNAAD